MKLVILDRDGTINKDSAHYIKSADEWTPIPGALEAIAKLNHAGWSVVIATNQSGIGRGLYDVMTLNKIHAKMHQLLANVGGRIDAIIFCPHLPTEQCACRKPLPAMYNTLLERYGLEAKDVPVVGDSLRDIVAAKAAGCPAHCVLTGKEGKLVDTTDFPDGTTIHSDLMAFALHLIASNHAPQKNS